MDINELTTLISTVGFPIIMCLILMKYVKDESDAHKEETGALKEAINELKLAITTLTERLNK